MELEKGRKYWCGWACRYGVFDRIITLERGGETKHVARFVDITGAVLSCDVRFIEKWIKDKKPT